MTQLSPRLAELGASRFAELAPALAERPSAPTAPQWRDYLPRVLALSDFVADICRRQPALIQELLASGDLFAPYDLAVLARRIDAAFADIADDAVLKQRLREWRRREFVRLAWRDLAGQATLAEVMATLSALADGLIHAALTTLTRNAYARIGVPRTASGEPMGLSVLALGKLGGNELNFSSDVDLIFCYAEDGELSGAGGLSHHEFFLRLGQALVQSLSEATADGFVFRVDMRLRPNGNSGPLVLSFDAMEHYYQTHGREWERYALLKARACAGDRAAAAALLTRLRPFVYRRYLDYGALDGMRAMKALIEAEVTRKGMADNIKRGPGGIREIEFVAQTLQLIRGGRERSLAVSDTLTALTRLAHAGHLAPPAAQALAEAYVFLRNAEHRLQMVADEQTHALPNDALGRDRLAAGMGSATYDDFERQLALHRSQVRSQFTALLAGAEPRSTGAPLATVWSAGESPAAIAALTQAGFAPPQEAVSLLRGFKDGPAYRALSSDGRARLDRLMPLLLGECAGAREPVVTLARMVRLLEAIGRRTAYFALLAENPTALSQLVNLAAASRFIATWIGQHPVLLDDLIDPRSLADLPTRAQLERELTQRLAGLPEQDLEAQMNALREFRNSQLLRVAATDLGLGLSPEAVGIQLSYLAEVVVGAALALARADLARRHGQPRTAAGTVPGFAVIAYGKLGGREIGYGSDLDMVFVYEDGAGETDGARPLANELYFARLGQRLIHLLTTRTSAGGLYDVDMRLRPSGRSGLLVTSIDAYRQYQMTQAWVWEHQALVRARAIVGTAPLCQRFADVRREVLCQPRDPARLRAEVCDMRSRMRSAHPTVPDQFDVKHDRGGIVDIEFMVQYWVLRWAQAHPGVTRETDNIHILQSLADAGVIAAEQARLLADCYRRWLATEHRLKLTEQGGRVPRSTLGEAPTKVAQLWQTVFENNRDPAVEGPFKPE